MSQTLSQPIPLPLETRAPSGALFQLLRGVACARLPDVGWIRIAGEDRTRWLNGMVTNAVAALKAGEGCYNFLLNAQGQIQGDGTIFSREADLLLETGRDQVAPVLAMLDRFIIMDDVELTDASSERSGLLLAGPGAPAALDSLLPGLSASPELSLRSATFGQMSLAVVHAYSPLVPRFELWAEAATVDALGRELLAHNIPLASPEDVETLRILEGTPRFGVDIRGRELPQETAQTRALHFNKGCYLGQEIVERVRSRGKLHRTFGGFLLSADQPPAGAEIFAKEQSVGVVTSVADLSSVPGLLPAGLRPALGYARRDALEGALALTCSGGEARPSPLPFPLGGGDSQ